MSVRESKKEPLTVGSNSCGSMSSRSTPLELSRENAAEKTPNPMISLPSLSVILRGPASLGLFHSRITGMDRIRIKVKTANNGNAIVSRFEV